MNQYRPQTAQYVSILTKGLSGKKVGHQAKH